MALSLRLSKTLVYAKTFPVYLCAAVLVGTGCGSKFSESSASSVTLKGRNLSERLVEKEKIDGRMNEIEKGVDKAKKIIELLRQLRDSEKGTKSYTPLDFILDLNAELKTKLPENKDNQLVRFGKMQVPAEASSPECRHVDVALATSPILSEAAKEPTVVGERLTYSMKPCGGKGEFQEVLVADWVSTNLEIRVINKNLTSIFRDTLDTAAERATNCKITRDDKLILDTVTCQNIAVQVSKTETAMISSMVFSNSGDTRYETKADIFENSRIKATFYLKVLSNGEKVVDLRPVDLKPADQK